MKDEIFQDIAQEALQNCHEKVHEATRQLMAEPLDAILFKIKNFLFLCQHLGNFTLKHHERYRMSLTDLYQAVRKMQEVPKQEENLKQKSLDLLKQSCEDLIIYSSKCVTSEASLFLLKVNAFKKTKLINLSQQSFATPDIVNKITANFVTNLDQLRDIFTRMDFYFGDKQAITVLYHLITVVKSNAETSYEYMDVSKRPSL
jgi:hypothetical protein